jgi:hypothetical protein
MRSPAETAARRWRLEGALRGIAFAALCGALVIAWWQASRRDEGVMDATHISISAGLDAIARDSVGALARAGRRVTWSGDVAALAASAEPVREPGDRWRIAVVSPTATSVRDSLGPLDSLDAPGGVITTMAARAAILVASGATEARVFPQDAVELGRVAVLGRAGWEPRFAMAALEEAGWEIDAHITLGRDRDVRQGVTSLRRSRHSAVVVFDTASLRRDASAIARFVREGGGVVLAGEAARAEPAAIRALAGARVLALEPPETRSFAGHEATHALPLHALGALRPDAVLVEDREGTPAVVARRVGAGRIIQLGYTDTWRWRMEGEGRAVEEHRAYWSRLVGLAAAATVVPREDAHSANNPLGVTGGSRAAVRAARGALDPAPLASLTHVLGAPSAAAATAAGRGPTLPLWLGPLILLALLAEWASRRGRGAA